MLRKVSVSRSSQYEFAASCQPQTHTLSRTLGVLHMSTRNACGRLGLVEEGSLVGVVSHIVECCNGQCGWKRRIVRWMDGCLCGGGN